MNQTHNTYRQYKLLMWTMSYSGRCPIWRSCISLVLEKQKLISNPKNSLENRDIEHHIVTDEATAIAISSSIF